MGTPTTVNDGWRWLQLRIDFDLTAIRQRDDHSTTYVTTVSLPLWADALQLK